MHILIDHISAVLIVGVLFVSLFTMMHRNQQNAMELQVNHVVNEQAYHFLNMLERDVENMLSSDQLTGIPLDTTCSLVNDFPDSTTKRTTSFSFPAMEVYPADSTGAFLDSVALVHLTYEMVDTGKKVMVNGKEQTLYKINRSKQTAGAASPVEDGTSGEIITNFSVTLFNENNFPAMGNACPSDVGNTKVEFEAASEISFDYVADDGQKKSRNNLNTTRYGATIYSPNR